MTAPGPTRLLGTTAFAILVLACVLTASHGQSLRALDYAGDMEGLGPRIVAAEGGPGSNPMSSAAGYGQFLAGTWLELFERTYPTVAHILSRDQILALRDVKPLAEDLANRYAQANAAALRDLGLPATAGELSLAHAVGPNGAVSVLTAEPARPAAELLRPEALVANPAFKGMTAGALRRWAAIRVNAPPAPSDDNSASAPDPMVHPLEPAALETERSTIAVLCGLVEAISHAGGGKGTPLRPATAAWLLSIGIEPAGLQRGDPSTLRMFDRAGSRVVLDAIREVSDQPGFREFKALEARAGPRAEFPRPVLRAVAVALLDKMDDGTAAAAKIVRHDRSRAKAPPRMGQPAPSQVGEEANAGPAVAAPPL